MQVKEVIVVEGTHDRDRILQAVVADVLVTGGSHIQKDVFDRIERAAQARGIIVLTDPDYTGNQIRKALAQRFPEAKHAYIARDEALKKGDVGVENASPEAIRAALQKVRAVFWHPEVVMSWSEMQSFGLVGTKKAAQRREKLGARLHIGYANAKTFYQRINALGVTRAELEEALFALDEEEGH
ncbi:ribonuclease M5 [Sulfoacidibacillus thermotolerans]|uniref:Ribonuclease M5 n=1 Tax=Sulfoacidibacillus thermotolerans TaxID=1765684 RepID=A0A2U3D8B4_SULT2|nr:ribonuclease M5 [Sulfoacidibacillus thermotolerans]PWI57523.1 ribonuclease M5 [Sulfoacidibacillus thermotolerans]